MKAIFLSSLFFFLISTQALAQRDGFIKGSLRDSASQNPISDATITILNQQDSTLVSFTRSGQGGEFMIRGLDIGRYRLLITHISYPSLSKRFSLSGQLRQLDFGNINLTPMQKTLDAVTVEQEIAPVTVKKDTIEFNAGSFKTKPNAVVEDLIKKLPGMQVDKNGTIKSNGEEVKKVLVDGKEFFGKDPTIASRNLPADAVDKVQVFDKKSDQSEFTGFDDGNREKTINLTIKKDRKNGVFGRLTAGAGTDDRYEGKLNLNQFRGDQQISLLGMANNINAPGFSFQEVMNFSSGISAAGGRGVVNADPFSSGIPIQGLTDNSQAITDILAGGLNFNDTWNKKTDVSGSYFYNRTNDHIDQSTTTRYFSPGNAYTQDQHNLSGKINENNRLNLGSDIRMDSLNSIKVTSVLILQKTSIASQKNYFSRQAADSSLLNDGYSEANNGGNGLDWNTHALFRHRFAKKGRTLSLNLDLGLNNARGNGNLFAINNYYQPKITDTINQISDLNNASSSYGANLVYTEPLSAKSLFEFTYNFNRIHSQSDKHTWDADPAGKYLIPNEALTNSFQNDYIYHREGIQFRNLQKKYNFTLGMRLEEASLSNEFGRVSGDSSLHQSFLNLLPNANLQYEFNKYRRLEFFYNSFTRQPGVTQLQPVADNSDPLNIKVGNPALGQEYYHLIRLNYLSFDPFRHTGFFAILNYTGVHNKIVNADLIAGAGQRISKPVNLNGLFNVSSNLSWDFPFRKIKSLLNLETRLAYDHNANLINGERNNSNNWVLSQRAGLNYAYKQIFDLSASVKIDYFDSKYSLQPEQNSSYWMQDYSLELNYYFPGGFSLASDLNYTHRNGLTGQYDQSPLIWNAGIGKQVFKNKKGEIRLQVFDILQQNVGISRNTSQNFVQDISYQVLKRYFLLSFTYQISRFAGKSIQAQAGTRDNIRIINQ